MRCWTFARLGREPIDRRAVDLAQVFREVFQFLEGERAQRTVELTVAALPAVTGDPTLLRQVVVNLVSNALKYTRPRAVARIEVGVQPVAPGAAPVFFVRDNGVGFDAANAGRLFGVFQRLHRADEFEGNGVGLATVRRIIERHGGSIRAEATPEGGATFYFTLAPDAAA